MRQVLRALGVLMVMVGLIAPASASAAGWLPEQPLADSAFGAGDGVVADGTILQHAYIALDGDEKQVLVRRVPGRDADVVDLSGEGEVWNFDTAIGSDGTVAAAVLTRVADGTTVRTGSRSSPPTRPATRAARPRGR